MATIIETHFLEKQKNEALAVVDLDINISMPPLLTLSLSESLSIPTMNILSLDIVSVDLM